MEALKNEVKQLKLENRETGRILFDQNEDSREICMKGLAECKKRLNLCM